MISVLIKNKFDFNNPRLYQQKTREWKSWKKRGSKNVKFLILQKER